MTTAGLPLGVTFSFLISSPMVDLGSLVLLMSIFGCIVAIPRCVLVIVLALLEGVFQGMNLGLQNLCQHIFGRAGFEI